MTLHRAVFRIIVIGTCVVLMTINAPPARTFQAEATTSPSQKIAQLTAKIREGQRRDGPDARGCIDCTVSIYGLQAR